MVHDEAKIRELHRRDEALFWSGVAALIGGILVLGFVGSLLVGCSPTVNGPWLSLSTTVQACPSPAPGVRPSGVIGPQ